MKLVTVRCPFCWHDVALPLSHNELAWLLTFMRAAAVGKHDKTAEAQLVRKLEAMEYNAVHPVGGSHIGAGR